MQLVDDTSSTFFQKITVGCMGRRLRDYKGANLLEETERAALKTKTLTDKSRRFTVTCHMETVSNWPIS